MTSVAASWRQFTEALAADMADTVDLLGRCYSGLEVRGDVLRLDPVLPDELAELRLTLTYRSHRLDVCVDHHQVTVASASCDAAPSASSSPAERRRSHRAKRSAGASRVRPLTVGRKPTTPARPDHQANPPSSPQ